MESTQSSVEEDEGEKSWTVRLLSHTREFCGPSLMPGMKGSKMVLTSPQVPGRPAGAFRSRSWLHLAWAFF